MPALGNQQTAQIDGRRHPEGADPDPSTGRRGGASRLPGLGVEVDEDKLMRYHESYQEARRIPDLFRQSGGMGDESRQ